MSSNCVSSALLQFCLLCGSNISSSTVSMCWVMTLLVVAWTYKSHLIIKATFCNYFTLKSQFKQQCLVMGWAVSVTATDAPVSSYIPSNRLIHAWDLSGVTLRNGGGASNHQNILHNISLTPSTHTVILWLTTGLSLFLIAQVQQWAAAPSSTTSTTPRCPPPPTFPSCLPTRLWPTPTAAWRRPAPLPPLPPPPPPPPPLLPLQPPWAAADDYHVRLLLVLGLASLPGHIQDR